MNQEKVINNQRQSNSKEIKQNNKKNKDILFPGDWQSSGSLVVTSESVNSAFNQNQSEFATKIFVVSFKMLAQRNSLFHQVIQIFWNSWGQSYL
jgi:phosphomevalonate kinase